MTSELWFPPLIGYRTVGVAFWVIHPAYMFIEPIKCFLDELSQESEE